MLTPNIILIHIIKIFQTHGVSHSHTFSVNNSFLCVVDTRPTVCGGTVCEWGPFPMWDTTAVIKAYVEDCHTLTSFFLIFRGVFASQQIGICIRKTKWGWERGRVREIKRAGDRWKVYVREIEKERSRDRERERSTWYSVRKSLQRNTTYVWKK